MVDVDGIFQRLEQLAQASRVHSQADQLMDLQNMLHISKEPSKETANLPCLMLPAVKKSTFYDRVEIMARLEEWVTEGSKRRDTKCLALFGYGGVGKSHIALRFAHTNLSGFDAIIWIYSETSTAISQSFTEVAMRLKLAGAHPQHHAKNWVLVLSWLQRTGEFVRSHPGNGKLRIGRV